MLQWKYLERYKMDWSSAVAASGRGRVWPSEIPLPGISL